MLTGEFCVRGCDIAQACEGCITPRTQNKDPIFCT